jgi:hypothetical protein
MTIMRRHGVPGAAGRVLARVNQRLGDTAGRLRSIAAERYPGVRELLTAAIQQITPACGDSQSSVGAVVPAIWLGVSLQSYSAPLSSVNIEAEPGASV